MSYTISWVFDLRYRRWIFTYDIAWLYKFLWYRIWYRIQYYIKYRIQYMQVILWQCDVLQVLFPIKHLTAVTKMERDLGTGIDYQEQQSSPPTRLLAPCNTILDLEIHLSTFFVMCHTGAFWIKLLWTMQWVSCQIHFQALVHLFYQSRTQLW